MGVVQGGGGVGHGGGSQGKRGRRVEEHIGLVAGHGGVTKRVLLAGLRRCVGGLCCYREPVRKLGELDVDSTQGVDCFVSIHAEKGERESREVSVKFQVLLSDGVSLFYREVVNVSREVRTCDGAWAIRGKEGYGHAVEIPTSPDVRGGMDFLRCVLAE